MEQMTKWLPVTELSNHQWLMAGVASTVLIVAIVFFGFRFKSVKQRIRRAIKRLGPKHVANLRIPDGMDGYLYIDYVVLTGKGLKLVSVKRFDGMIYGSEGLEHWRQVTPSGSYEFPNPLKELEIKANALRTILPDVDTEKLVLFEGKNSFPKSMPDNVVQLEQLDVQGSSVPLDEHLQSSWQKVCEIAS